MELNIKKTTHLKMSSCAMILQYTQHMPSVGFDQYDSVA